MTTVQFPLWRAEPREASLTVAGGASAVYNRSVPVVLSTRDHATGFNNVTEMKVWGDIDPGFQPELFGATDGESKWLQFETSFHLVLSVGAGVKTIHAKIRNVAHAEVALEASTSLKNDIPHASLLWHDRPTVMVDAPAATHVEFAWSPSTNHGGYLIAMVNGTENDALAAIGGELVYGNPGNAGDINWERIAVEDILAADRTPTQAGGKVLKIFILVNGKWWPGDQGAVIAFDQALWDYANWDSGVWA